ncbi:phage tail tape measure protein [Breoghania sp. JC706]|uniref:phage tail tape measure protein n=1 Tax=Breoghania sp. JC706 TaxID=3117732 RepID=UPI0030083175
MPATDDTGFDLPFDDLTRFRSEMRLLNSAAGDFSRVLSGALKGAVADGKQLDDVLRKAALSFSANLVSRSLNSLASTLTSTLLNAFSGGGSATAFAKGGTVRAFAQGGVVAAPTYFPMADGGTGLAGEAGAEAILPLARGADGRLGVRGAGGSGGIAVTFNVTTPDAESFARSELQLSRMVARVAGRGQRGL